MYNTPREDPAYIVLGVEKRADNSYVVTGIHSHPDGADLVNMFNGWVHPIPHFHYEPARLHSTTIAIIVIPPNPPVGPCLPRRDLPNSRHAILRQHQLYTRRGSQNAAADDTEQRAIYDWFGEAPRPATVHAGTSHEDVWNELLEEVHDFGPQYYYGLVSSPLTDSDDYFSSLGFVDWSFVLDFDSTTDTRGLLSRVRDPLGSRRTVHLLTLGDRVVVTSLTRATYWFCAAGLSGRDATIPSSRAVDWSKKYGQATQQFLAQIATHAAARPIVLIVLWKAEYQLDHLNAILHLAIQFLPDSVRIAIITDGQSTSMQQRAELFDARLFVIPIQQFCLGVRASIEARVTLSEDRRLPSSSGAEIAVPPNKWAWLSEELQIVHLSEGTRAPDAPDITHPGSGFLRGNEVTWYDLGLQYDVPRTITPTALRRIRDLLGTRRAQRINLRHAPGAGGTTVSRRVIWDLHNEFPCALLLKTAEPLHTRDRLAYLAKITERSILLVVDAGAITDRDADLLYEQVAAAHLPVLLLQVIRHYGRAPSRSTLYVNSQLDQTEAERFIVFLSREVPMQEPALHSTPLQQRTPFLLALVAFGRDFVALGSYVARRLETPTEVQKQCIVIFSMAHYYGQRSVPIQLFAGYLGLSEKKPVTLENLCPSQSFDILVEAERGYWRTVHSIVAEECIRQVLMPTIEGADPRAWRYQLSAWCREIVRFCRGRHPEASSEGRDLANRVFVFRGNSELIGSERAGSNQFSMLINDLPSPEARLEVLRALTERFPHEAHLWAHLGRFYSVVLKEYEKAADAIEESISIQPADHVLHHMKGMNLRARLYDRIADRAALEDVAELAKEAAEAFGEARRLRPDDEHGYISEVQMTLRVLDYCGELRGEAPIVAVASAQCPEWIRDCTEKVESLLATVRESRRGEEASVYEEDCRARLGAIYGDYSTALQRWNSLLDRAATYRPSVRRQIVWTYLARKGRDWSALSGKEVGRSIELLEENLREDPDDERNFRLWLRAIRYSEVVPSVETVIEKLSAWHVVSDSVEPAYYLFVMHVLRALEGSRLAAESVGRYLEECRKKTRYRRNRTRSFEWIGTGAGLRRLVHHDSLGMWDRGAQFWSDRSLLDVVDGVVVRIQGPEAGEIEIEGGLRAFYVPGRVDHHSGNAENRRVQFFLGFSYDGLRAWEVRDYDGAMRGPATRRSTAGRGHEG